MAYNGTDGVNGNGLLTFWTLVKNWIRNTFQLKVTGGASTILDSNLTTGKALVSDANGKVSSSGVSSTELGYLSGVTSGVQNQLNGKQEKISFILQDGTTRNDINGVMSAGNVKLMAASGSGVKLVADCLASGVRVDGSVYDCNALQLLSGSGIVLSFSNGSLTIDRSSVSSSEITSALGFAPVGNLELGSLQNSLNSLASRVDAMKNFRYAILENGLGSSGEENVLYLVPADADNAESNVYDQYLWIVDSNSQNGRWEKIGDTRIDLSGYVQRSEFLTSSEITELFNSVA